MPYFRLQLKNAFPISSKKTKALKNLNWANDLTTEVSIGITCHMGLFWGWKCHRLQRQFIGHSELRRYCHWSFWNLRSLRVISNFNFSHPGCLLPVCMDFVKEQGVIQIYSWQISISVPSLSTTQTSIMTCFWRSFLFRATLLIGNRYIPHRHNKRQKTMFPWGCHVNYIYIIPIT